MNAPTPAAGPTAERDDALDPRRVRRDFAIFDRTVHDRRLAYLDNGATTQRPRVVLDAMRHLEETACANVHRGVHLLSQEATDAFEGARRTVAEHVGASSPAEIVFTRGTTEAINLVASTFARERLRDGDEIVVTELEHHSNIVPWQMAAEARGARLVVVPMGDDGSVSIEHFEAALSPRTRLAAVSHVSNALGTVLPVRAFTEIAREREIPVLIDGAQAVGHGAVDVAAIGCDFYAFSAHKMYGPTGIGALWAKREHLEAMPPWQGGGDMIASVSFDGTTFNDVPHKFEAGTPNVVGAVGLAAAIRYLRGLGLDRIARHESALLERVDAALAGVPGLTAIGTAPKRSTVASFQLGGIHPHDAGTVLDLEGVAVRAGHHCAQPVMDHFGIPGTLRASIGVYNDDDDIEALVAGLHKVREVFA